MNTDKAAELVQNIEDGIESGLKGYAILVKHIKFLTECANQIKPIALDEASRYEDKKFEDHGFSFELRNGGKQFDFKNCSEWTKAKNNIKSIEDDLKSKWNASQKGEMIISQEGEVIEIPTVTFRSDAIIVK